MKHDPTNGNSTTIATKISLGDKVRLSRIADSFGMTLYELMQFLLIAMARYFDKGNAVTYEGNTLLNAIGNIMFADKDSFCPMALKNRQKQHICNAILFLQREQGQRPQLIEWRDNTQGSMIESYNYDGMLSAFLNCIDPDGLQRLKDEAKRWGYFSITHTLHEIIMQQTARTKADTISEDVRDLFSDIRLSTGEKINDDTQYKRKPNRGNEYTTMTARETHRADI